MRHSRTHMWLFGLIVLNMLTSGSILVAIVRIAVIQSTLQSVVQEMVITERLESLHQLSLAQAKSDRHPENEEARAAIVEARRFIDLGDQLLAQGDEAGALPLYRSTGRLIEKMENQLKCGEPSCNFE